MLGNTNCSRNFKLNTRILKQTSIKIPFKKYQIIIIAIGYKNILAFCIHREIPGMPPPGGFMSQKLELTCGSVD